MKLGILMGDNVEPELQDKLGTYESYFKDFLTGFNGFKIVFYNVHLGNFPYAACDCDAYLISGSRKSAYEKESWILALRDFIRQAYVQKIKLSGICFGHQVLAEALGGKTTKNPSGWGLGIHQFDVCREEPWMKPAKEKLKLGLSCQDQVCALPPKAVRFLTSDFVPNAAFHIPNRVFSLQGHPEFESKFMRYLIEKRRILKDIDEETHGRLSQTLSDEPDNELIGQWLFNFLTR